MAKSKRTTELTKKRLKDYESRITEMEASLTRLWSVLRGVQSGYIKRLDKLEHAQRLADARMNNFSHKVRASQDIRNAWPAPKTGWPDEDHP